MRNLMTAELGLISGGTASGGGNAGGGQSGGSTTSGPDGITCGPGTHYAGGTNNGGSGSGSVGVTIPIKGTPVTIGGGGSGAGNGNSWSGCDPDGYYRNAEGDLEPLPPTHKRTS